MNRLIILLLMTASIMSSCNQDKGNGPIGRQNPEIKNGKLTPEVLWAFGRIGNVEVSPDGKKVLYMVTFYDIAQNKGNSEIFVMNTDGTEKRQLTISEHRESSAKWMNDSENILFISNKKGSAQLWKMKVDGTDDKEISEWPDGISDFLISPDGKKVIFIAEVKAGKSIADRHPDLPEASGYIAEDLMYKHWDEWTGMVPHPFVADFDGKHLTNAKDLLEGEPFEAPVKPNGGIEQLAWSPDSKTIVYCSRKKTGKAYAISTNSDIYFYDLASGETKNVTEGLMGYDLNPAFSPDGKWMSWESQEREGCESDKHRLFVMNLQTGEKKDLSVNFDQNSESLVWSNDSKLIYFVSVWHGVYNIYKADIQSGEITQITKGVHDYKSVVPAGDALIGVKCSMSKPHEIFSVNPVTGAETEISFENKHILDQLKMGKVEERWVKTTDNKDMLVWVVYPPGFDPSKKYPAVLYCQGGPQSAVSQFWSFRWNLQTMAAAGYIIVAPNRRGLPGFGQAWNDQISGDYGGQNMKDYLSAIDAVSAESYVDKDKLGCVGASYGGFSVFWMAGHHEKRFKAFIAHAGMFNLEQQYLETEEMWFVNWDLGGAYWEKDNATAMKSYANSPHLFVDKWDTPILVTHGEKDYRILASQGMAAFNAAILRGVPAKLLVYPDENHWIMKPQNGILWQRTFIGWLDEWLKEKK